MSETRLGRDVFLALAAVGWADGHLEQIAEIDEATKQPLDLGVIDRTGLTKEDRLFVYAVASWMTRLDAVVAEKETIALKKLGDELKIPDNARAQADAIAQEVAFLPDGDRPDRYDLPRIRKIIGARLAVAQAIRTGKNS